MLALVDNQLAYIEPALDIQGGFDVWASKPNLKGEGRVYLRIDDQPLESGMIFYVMAGQEHCKINPRTGRFKIAVKAEALIRVVFQNQHLELVVRG